MAKENPTWGEERISDELSLKLGLHIDSRTIRKYLKQGRPRKPSDQRWATFVRNHAKAIVACDFFVSVTATFNVVYVFVAIVLQGLRSMPKGASTLRSDGSQLSKSLQMASA